MIVLLGRVFLAADFFPFSTLNVSCHPLLACKVAAEKSADSLLGVSLVCNFPSVLLFLKFSIFNL